MNQQQILTPQGCANARNKVINILQKYGDFGISEGADPAEKEAQQKFHALEHVFAVDNTVRAEEALKRHGDAAGELASIARGSNKLRMAGRAAWKFLTGKSAATAAGFTVRIAAYQIGGKVASAAVSLPAAIALGAALGAARGLITGKEGAEMEHQMRARRRGLMTAERNSQVFDLKTFTPRSADEQIARCKKYIDLFKSGETRTGRGASYIIHDVEYLLQEDAIGFGSDEELIRKRQELGQALAEVKAVAAMLNVQNNNEELERRLRIRRERLFQDVEATTIKKLTRKSTITGAALGGFFGTVGHEIATGFKEGWGETLIGKALKGGKGLFEKVMGGGKGAVQKITESAGPAVEKAVSGVKNVSEKLAKGDSGWSSRMGEGRVVGSASIPTDTTEAVSGTSTSSAEAPGAVTQRYEDVSANIPPDSGSSVPPGAEPQVTELTPIHRVDSVYHSSDNFSIVDNARAKLDSLHMPKSVENDIFQNHSVTEFQISAISKLNEAGFDFSSYGEAFTPKQFHAIVDLLEKSGASSDPQWGPILDALAKQPDGVVRLVQLADADDVISPSVLAELNLLVRTKQPLSFENVKVVLDKGYAALAAKTAEANAPTGGAGTVPTAPQQPGVPASADLSSTWENARSVSGSQSAGGAGVNSRVSTGAGDRSGSEWDKTPSVSDKAKIATKMPPKANTGLGRSGAGVAETHSSAASQTETASSAALAKSVNPEAVVRSGDGPTQVIKRQIDDLIKKNPEKWGFKGSISNATALDQFAARKSFDIASENGYIRFFDKDSGVPVNFSDIKGKTVTEIYDQYRVEETRIKGSAIGRVAYRYDEATGKVTEIDTKTSTSNSAETGVDNYEYLDKAANLAREAGAAVGKAAGKAAEQAAGIAGEASPIAAYLDHGMIVGGEDVFDFDPDVTVTEKDGIFELTNARGDHFYLTDADGDGHLEPYYPETGKAAAEFSDAEALRKYLEEQGFAQKSEQFPAFEKFMKMAADLRNQPPRKALKFLADAFSEQGFSNQESRVASMILLQERSPYHLLYHDRASFLHSIREVLAQRAFPELPPHDGVWHARDIFYPKDGAITETVGAMRIVDGKVQVDINGDGIPDKLLYRQGLDRYDPGFAEEGFLKGNYPAVPKK